MPSNAQALASLLRTDPAYKAWFTDWWAQDFSISGRRRDLRANGYVEKSEFAGRVWPTGWAPPHDLDGNINSSFSMLSESSNRTYWWQYINADLRGAFLSGGGPGYLASSVGGYSYCYIDEDVNLVPNSERVAIDHCYFSKSASLGLERASTVDATWSFFGGSLSLTNSRRTSYDLSHSVIKGNFEALSAQLDGKADRARVSGTMTISGSFEASRLVCNDFRSHGSQKGAAGHLKIPGAKARSLDLSGSYSSVIVDGLKANSLRGRIGDAETFSARKAKISNVALSGTVGECIFKETTTTKLFEMAGLDARKLDLSESNIKRIRAQGGVFDVFDLSQAEIAEEVEFSKTEFTEELAGRSARFGGHVSLSRCAMPGIVDFSGANFDKGASLKVGSGVDVVRQPGYNQIGQANFSTTRFMADKKGVCVNFDGRKMLEAADFEAAVFSGVPMFYECEFHENVNFRGASFLIEPPEQSYLQAVSSLDWAMFARKTFRAFSLPIDVNVGRIFEAWSATTAPLRERRASENRRLADYERAYNALRQRFEDVGNAKYERQFHNFELRARRRRIDSDAPPVEGIISWVYDATSRYGQSISRPLGLLVGFWLFFGLIYFLFAGVFTFDAGLESAVFSARQIIKPFSVWGRDFYLSATGPVTTTPADWISALLSLEKPGEVARSTLVRLFATGQSLLSILLLFLSGLAVRRTFGVG